MAIYSGCEMSGSKKVIAGSSDKTALDLTSELNIARERFHQQRQNGLFNRSSKVSKKKPALLTKSSMNTSKELERARQYKMVMKGKVRSDLIDVLSDDSSKSDGSSDGDDDDDDEQRMVEIEDEDGLTKKVPARNFENHAPSTLLYGDIVQRGSFQLDNNKADDIRNKSKEPQKDLHYDANWEIRDKGAGFYKFSTDNDERKRQMQSLGDIRKETEQNQYEFEFKNIKQRRQDRIHQRWEKIENQRSQSIERMKRIGQLL